MRIFDPFMGGGTTMIEANRLGCDITGTDVNPTAWWVVRQELQDLDVPAYTQAAERLRAHLEAEVGDLYRTTCTRCGNATAQVKYFLWVKTARCGSCGSAADLFPNFLLAENVRHPANVFVCGCCGELFETEDRERPGPCCHCGQALPLERAARRNRGRCGQCGRSVAYPGGGAPEHRQFAIEYHCQVCAQAAIRGKGRLFQKSDADDLARFEAAASRLRRLRPQFIPEDLILEGDETERLHRWGYQRYRELFNARQLLGLELSCRWIAAVKTDALREALATNLSDLLRYQNMLCRYDTMALKSLDVFSVHGFPVGLIQCESNLLGIRGPGGSPVGSGGWLNIIEKFAKAKRYCAAPFEIRQQGTRKIEVPVAGEWIGSRRNEEPPTGRRAIRLCCGDSSEVTPDEGLFDAVFTDPPYFGNVQYAELMDFCYVWLRRLVGDSRPEFRKPSTRHVNELTGNVNMGRGLDHFTEGLSKSFRLAASRLKPGRPLAFTYHHNQLEAYVPVAVAILDAGLVCSASLPCPAEMGASIHINGTALSIVDTVFVCRSTGSVRRRWLASDLVGRAEIVRRDVQALAEAGLKATQGDIRCICCGHLSRLAIWDLRTDWSREAPIAERILKVGRWFSSCGGIGGLLGALTDTYEQADRQQQWTQESLLREAVNQPDEVPF